MKRYAILSSIGAMCLFTFLMFVPSVAKSIPHLINYQGRLTDSGGNPITGSSPVVFSLYTTETGGGSVWSESRTVAAVDGVFSVELGKVSGIPALVFMSDDVYLGIKVGTDAEMAPRSRITSVGYAFTADKALYADNAGNATNADTVDGIDTTELVQSADHTKAMHDALGIDADMVDGQHAADIIDAALDAVLIPIDAVPFTITSSMGGNSFCLTGNLAYSSSTGNAITVEANNVTIDMMGYTLSGPGKASGTNSGIYMYGKKSVEIRNGTVQGFGDNGIAEMSTETGSMHRVINVSVLDNGNTGLCMYGNGHTVKECLVAGSGQYGMVVGEHSTVTHCNFNNNDYDGIWSNAYCIFTDNSIYENGRYGINAPWYGQYIKGNTVNNNTSTGILTTSSNITENYVRANGDVGILSSGGTIAGNTVISNYNSGIQTDNCLVTYNTVSSNNVSDNSANGGIVVNDSCIVKGNLTSSNKQANIYSSGTHNAIEDNQAMQSNMYGINLGATGGNWYSNNRAGGNGLNPSYNYINYPLSTDGGGNVSW